MQTAVHPPAPSPLRRLTPWAWLLLPLACHLGFSWIGFTPTDDGWLQAVARRLLNGEVPHRDFISLRPVVSAALQVPLVALGGDHVLWLARLWGWLVVGGLSWLWSGNLLPTRPAAWLRPLLYAVIFFLTAQVFPVMAWHSLDGLLLAAAAVTLARRGTAPAWRAAFFCAGLAALCRQNFVFFIPFLLLGVPDWRQWRHALWIGAAPAAYALVMLATGALADCAQQLFSPHSQLYQAAVRPYVETPAFFLGLGAGLVVAAGLGLIWRGPERIRELVAHVGFLGTGLFAVYNLWHGSRRIAEGSFGLFGFACVLLAAVAWQHRDRAAWFVPAAAIGLAWTAAISIGYNHPALMGGVLLVVIWRLLELAADRPLLSTPTGLVLMGLTLAGLATGFRYARLNYPYQDKPADELTWDAGAVLRGAAGLRTNAVTYAVLADLRRLTDRYEQAHLPYAIMTDYAAAWVRSPQRNLLACDWPQVTEIGDDPRLVERFIRQLCSLPPGTQVIAQKDLISTVQRGLQPVATARQFYAAQDWLEQHGRLVGETEFFRLYAPPRLQVESAPAGK